MEFEKISIREDFIRLDSAMKLANLVVTGGHAKIVIQNGEVKVNNEVIKEATVEKVLAAIDRELK